MPYSQILTDVLVSQEDNVFVRNTKTQGCLHVCLKVTGQVTISPKLFRNNFLFIVCNGEQKVNVKARCLGPTQSTFIR